MNKFTEEKLEQAFIELLHEEDITHLLKEALYEFPIHEVKIEVPRWIALMDTSSVQKLKSA